MIDGVEGAEGQKVPPVHEQQDREPLPPRYEQVRSSYLAANAEVTAARGQLAAIKSREAEVVQTAFHEAISSIEDLPESIDFDRDHYHNGDWAQGFPTDETVYYLPKTDEIYLATDPSRSFHQGQGEIRDNEIPAQYDPSSAEFVGFDTIREGGSHPDITLTPVGESGRTALTNEDMTEILQGLGYNKHLDAETRKRLQDDFQKLNGELISLSFDAESARGHHIPLIRARVTDLLQTVGRDLGEKAVPQHIELTKPDDSHPDALWLFPNRGYHVRLVMAPEKIEGIFRKHANPDYDSLNKRNVDAPEYYWLAAGDAPDKIVEHAVPRKLQEAVKQ